jgi:hypothetical protein
MTGDSGDEDSDTASSRLLRWAGRRNKERRRAKTTIRICPEVRRRGCLVDLSAGRTRIVHGVAPVDPHGSEESSNVISGLVEIGGSKSGIIIDLLLPCVVACE